MFYLPIYVNNRCMHILHLQEEKQYLEYSSLCLHSFIMKAESDYEIISFPSDNAQLICDDGENVELSNMGLTLSKLDNSPYEKQYPGMNCYQLLINTKESTIKSLVEKMYLDGKTNGTPENNDHLKIEASQQFKNNEYILQVKYTHNHTKHGVQESTDYIAAIRVYTYKHESAETVSAILDFGSDASQVYFKGDADSINLREAFCTLTGYSNQVGYWQGRPDDDEEHQTLYKSIYHIHTQPESTFFGDLPMNNKEKTFIQSLLPVNHRDFSNLVLLPNLKLIELLNYKINSTDVDFGSPQNTNIIKRAVDSLGTQELRDGILRQILCNFLAVIMNRKQRSGSKNLCLYFTLLVPNVYDQRKVATIIDGLYQDFEILCYRHRNLFECYRGIEIQTISESDASYFGVPLTIGSSEEKVGAYVLTIDAGKGTTDFSLLHQSGVNLSHYESVYRSGIPASGHVLTYAFFEALKEYFIKIDSGDTFEKLMRNAFEGQNKHNLLALTAKLEKQKINYEQFINNKYDSSQDAVAKKVSNWKLLLAYLDTLNAEKTLLPGIREKVEAKVEAMVRLFQDSIIQYAIKNEIKLLKVYLSGRAFRFEPFRKAVEKALLDNKLIEDTKQIVFNSDKAKNACLKGGIDYSAHTVNRKSSMLSVPTMFVVRTGPLKRIYKRFRLDKPLRKPVDFDFFYKGLTAAGSTNVEIDICGRIYHQGHDTDTNFSLYFVGNGYLLKYGNKTKCKSIIISEKPENYSCDYEILQQLTLESLFPFDLKSMGYDSKDENSPIVEHTTMGDSIAQVPSSGKIDNNDTNTTSNNQGDITSLSYDD